MRVKLIYGVLLIYALATIPFLSNLLLSYDEAHYALYGYYLNWSYFDHPPLVGWIQAVMQLLGDNEFLLRLPAFLCSAAVLAGIWFFIKSSSLKSSIIAEQTFFIALLLFLSIPMFMLLSFALVPDTLLMALTLPIIIQTQRTLVNNSWRDYLLLGLLIGLAALTKYTAVLLAVGSAFYIIWIRGTKVLGDPRCWLAVCLALLIFSPVIIWNIQSGGSSFAYQLDHGFGREWLNFPNILLSQLLQMFAYGPLVYVLALATIIWIITKKRSELYILVFFAAPIFLVFFISPAFGKFLPHWVAAMFVALLPASAIMLYETITSAQGNNLRQLSFTSIKQFFARRKFVSVLLVLMLIISFAIVLPLRLLVSGLEVKFPPYANPHASLIGWDDTSRLIKQDADNNVGDEEQFIFVNNWSYASPFAWYARPMKVIVMDSRLDQFDVWFGSPQQGQSGYLIVSSHDKGSDKRRQDFASCNLWNEKTYSIKSSPALTLVVYKCINLLK